MGQVLGFSHCKEFGSVSSTPDSTPPCTDGGNEESELYDLQTAREWSEEEDGGEDDDGGTSSPSIWGTPRQNSFELTFSYIAIAEAEAGGALRHHRDTSSGGRRRAGARGGRTSLSRTDTVETLLPLDSPDVDWDPNAFFTREEEEGEREREEERERELHRQTVTEQPSFLDTNMEESQERDTGIQRGEMETPEPQPPKHYSPADSHQLSLSLGPESLVTMETTVTLLTAVRPGGRLTDDMSSTSSSSIGRDTQEQLVSEQWFSAINLSEGPTISTHIAVMDLIYWKDTERTGMVFTGVVVGLLSLFQLSIITVISTVSLAIMCFTISVCLYYKFLHLLNFGDGLHPFKAYLDPDISLSGEQAEHYMQRAILLAVSAVEALKKLIFVGNIFDSLKFLALMYLVTYLGDLCNGLTLLIIGVISLFSLPLFYRQHQAQVDNFLAGIQAKIDNIKDILHRLAQGGGPTPDPTPGGAKPKTH